MKKAIKTDDEQSRIEALDDYEILDTPRESSFDQITETAAIVCECKISLVSLVDKDRQWFKSSYGLDAKETPRDISYCGHAIQSDEIFEIENSELDEDFCDNPLFLGEPHVRFYAGAPLIAKSGHRLGTLCVIDDKEKKLTKNQKIILKNLASQVVNLMDSKRHEREIEGSEKIKLIASEIKSEYIKYQKDPHKFFDYILSNILRITESEYGFIGEIKINPETKEKYLKTFSLTNIAWNEETRNFYNENAPSGLEFHNLETLFGRVIKSEEPMITNDPLKNPYSAGIPQGHPDLNAFMGIPIFQAGRMIGMAGIANRKQGYSKKLYNNISYLIETIGEVIYAHQINRDLLSTQLFNNFYKIALDKAAIVAFTDNCGKITYANEMFCQISKYSTDELIGQDHRILNSGIHGKDFFRDLWHTIKNGETWKGEICNKAKDGSHYWVDTVIVPYKNSAGEIDKFIAIRKDITQEKLKQQLLDKAVEESKAATEAKSDFLSSMSHEIRTPLNGTIGMLSLLKETELDNFQRDYIKSMEQSSNSLLILINDILDFSKIEAGKMELEETFFNLGSFVKDVITPFKYTAQSKGISFDFEVNNSEFSILSDSGRIGQIINNLMSNAIKFTTKGKVSFFLDTTRNNKKGFLEFKVVDTGVGIPEESKYRMFQAFSQADSSVSRKFGGTGLGLSISHRIVKLMKGEISFESVEGEGTTFFVKIPFSSSKEKEVEENSESGENIDIDMDIKISKLNILVAEDNQTNQVLMASILKKIGCKYQIVSNGNEALDSLRSFDFDLIIMDCQMPELDGLEATKIIRSSPSFTEEKNNIPIIALTANAIKGYEQSCYEVGMNDFLTKPITFSHFKKKLISFVKNNNIVIKNWNSTNHVDLSNNSSIADLIKQIGKDGVQELAESFYTSSAENLENILSAMEVSDYGVLAKEAHSLKSTTRLFGAEILSSALEKVEREAKSENPKLDFIKECINKIEVDLKELSVSLKSFFSEDKNNVSSAGVLKVALVEDDPNIHLLVTNFLRDNECLELSKFYDLKEFNISLEKSNFDVVILDIQLGRDCGLEYLSSLIKEERNNFSTILLSSTELSDIPNEILHKDNVTFHQKPINKENLLNLLKIK